MRLLSIAISQIAVTLLLLGFATSSVAAQDAAVTPSAAGEAPSNSFAFYPAEIGFGTYFEVTAESGTAEEFVVLLANTGSVTQDLRTYPSQAYTAEGGGLAVAEFGKEPDGVTKWLSLQAETHTVESGMGVEITFTMEVPESVEPGQYVTSVVAEHVNPLPIEGTDMLTQTFRYAIPIFITIPGDTEASFEVTHVTLQAENDTQILTIELSNTGDVHLRPEGEIRVRDHDGDVLATIPAGMGEIFAGDKTTLAFALPTIEDANGYDISVQLSDKDTGAEATAEESGLIVQAPATPAPPPPINIASASVEPGPDADNVQFAVVDVTIANTGESVTNAQLSLLVFRGGEEVERFPISQSLALPGGDTDVNTRYIPLEGWSTGEWTFELLLERVEGGGAAVVVASQPIDGAITIP